MILFFIKDDIKNIDIEINQYSIINLLSDLERLSKICVFFSTIYFYKDNDLFNDEENSERWLKIKKNFKRIILYPRNKIKKSIKKILDLVQTEYASVSKTYNEHEAKSIRIVVSGFYMAYFYIFKKKLLQNQKNFY